MALYQHWIIAHFDTYFGNMKQNKEVKKKQSFNLDQ